MYSLVTEYNFWKLKFSFYDFLLSFFELKKVIYDYYMYVNPIDLTEVYNFYLLDLQQIIFLICWLTFFSIFKNRLKRLCEKFTWSDLFVCLKIFSSLLLCLESPALLPSSFLFLWSFCLCICLNHLDFMLLYSWISAQAWFFPKQPVPLVGVFESASFIWDGFFSLMNFRYIWGLFLGIPFQSVALQSGYYARFMLW